MRMPIALPAGDVARRSLGLLRRRGRLVCVWTNAQRWVEEAGGWAWLGKARCALDMAAWWVVQCLFGACWCVVECCIGGCCTCYIAAPVGGGLNPQELLGRAWPHHVGSKGLLSST